MGVEKYSIEERISMIRISYSLLRMDIRKHEREQPKAIETKKTIPDLSNHRKHFSLPIINKSSILYVLLLCFCKRKHTKTYLIVG